MQLSSHLSYLPVAHVCCVSFNKVISIAVLLSSSVCLSVCHICMCFANWLKVIKHTLRHERHVTLHWVIGCFGLQCTQRLLLSYITRQRIGKRFRWCMRRSWHVIDAICHAWGAEREKQGCRFRVKPVVMLCLGWWRARQHQLVPGGAIRSFSFKSTGGPQCRSPHLTCARHIPCAGSTELRRRQIGVKQRRNGRKTS